MRDLSWGEDDLIGEIERGSEVKDFDWDKKGRTGF